MSLGKHVISIYYQLQSYNFNEFVVFVLILFRFFKDPYRGAAKKKCILASEYEVYFKYISLICDYY